MLRNTMDIPPECRECLGVGEAVARLAILQAMFSDQLGVSADASGRHITYTGSISEARQSDLGKLYTEAESDLLCALELATFCAGKKEDCFQQSLQSKSI
jgi:hypothetical protein